MKIEIARVNRNGAKNKIQMARELAKADAFQRVSLADIIATLRTYERDGLFTITDTELILYHVA